MPRNPLIKITKSLLVIERNSTRHTELSFSRGRNRSHGDRELCIGATQVIAQRIDRKLSELGYVTNSIRRGRIHP